MPKFLPKPQGCASGCAWCLQDHQAEAEVQQLQLVLEALGRRRRAVQRATPHFRFVAVFAFFRGSPLSCFCPSLWCPGLTAARNPAVNGLCLFPYHTLKFLNASVCMCWIASWWRCARPMPVGNLHFVGCLAAWPLVHPLPRACGCACSCAQDFAKYFIVWCVLGPVCPTVRSPAPVCVSQIGGPSPVAAAPPPAVTTPALVSDPGSATAASATAGTGAGAHAGVGRGHVDAAARTVAGGAY